MRKDLIKSLIDFLFSVLIPDQKISQELIIKISLDHISTRKPKWKVKYLFYKLRYASDRYKKIYGFTLYCELADRILKILDVEEEKRLKKIDEAIKVFLKDA